MHEVKTKYFFAHEKVSADREWGAVQRPKVFARSQVRKVEQGEVA